MLRMYSIGDLRVFLKECTQNNVKHFFVSAESSVFFSFIVQAVIINLIEQFYCKGVPMHVLKTFSLFFFSCFRIR